MVNACGKAWRGKAWPGKAGCLGAVMAVMILAPGTGPALAQETEATEDGDPVTDYFVGNLLFVFYHELGHGLIHKLELPVLGREEDAADQLATLMLMDSGTDSVGGEPVLTAALGWFQSWQKRDGETEEADYWDEHSLDLQRYANIICLVYGSDPENYKDLIEDWDLPADRAESCPIDFESAAASWDGAMADVWVPEDAPPPENNGSFTLTRMPAKSAGTKAIAEYIADLQIFEAVVDDLNGSLVLPSPIKVVARDCDEENAFYDSETSEITMCYELLATFMADAEKSAE